MKRKRGGQPGNKNACDEFSVLRFEIKSAHSETQSINRQLKEELVDKYQREAMFCMARMPLEYLKKSLQDSAIDRDADSFYFVNRMGRQARPDWGALPPGHPILATNLTDAQWHLLQPLIPPDPVLDWLLGTPPMMIAANRWKFTFYLHDDEFSDQYILSEYLQTLKRFPALLSVPYVPPRVKKRGPKKHEYHPRALLDGILWKIGTGMGWDDLPTGFPPARRCREYYRRLFCSGRWYSLLHTLYNHFIEHEVYLELLHGRGFFTCTYAQTIGLAKNVEVSWQAHTALLFMQIARGVYMRDFRINWDQQLFPWSRSVHQSLSKNPGSHAPLIFLGNDKPSLGVIPQTQNYIRLQLELLNLKLSQAVRIDPPIRLKRVKKSRMSKRQLWRKLQTKSTANPAPKKNR